MEKLLDKVQQQLKYGMNIEKEEDIAFGAIWVSRRTDGSLNMTWMHLEEEDVTDDLRKHIVRSLRNLADSIQGDTEDEKQLRSAEQRDGADSGIPAAMNLRKMDDGSMGDFDWIGDEQDTPLP